jgi:hypothetical protein
MITKLVDKKGRVALGPQFAGRTVIMDDSNPNQIVITVARVIPEREAWLYENQDALNSVRRGLAQAAAGQLVREGVDLEADAALAAELDDS